MFISSAARKHSLDSRSETFADHTVQYEVDGEVEGLTDVGECHDVPSDVTPLVVGVDVAQDLGRGDKQTQHQNDDDQSQVDAMRRVTHLENEIQNRFG